MKIAIVPTACGIETVPLAILLLPEARNCNSTYRLRY